MMKNKPIMIITILIIIIVTSIAALYFWGLWAIKNDIQPNVNSETSTTIENNTWSINTSPLNGLSLVDNTNIYQNDTNDVIHIYLTILKGKDKETGAVYTFSDINNYEHNITSREPFANVIFQEGTESGPISEGGNYENESPNARMTLRGQSSRTMPQKSYQIKLNDSTGLWREQQTLNLNKHYSDTLRIKNKFCYDIFKLIPDFISLRTQFIYLHIKDMTKADADDKFVDYGLYTHIEQPNKRFLKNHGLNPEGNLYKAEFFEFFRYSDYLKKEDDKTFDKTSFEQVLEIKEGNNHEKLIMMLDDVNDYNLDINDVIDKHFNRDNYLTWLAVNILLGNVDSNSRNFLLYSPTNSLTWYFLPWDYDKTLFTQSEVTRDYGYLDTIFGIADYWGVVLHKRFFKNPSNVEELSHKIDELMNILTKEKTIKSINEYKSIVNNYVFSLPDIKYLRRDAYEILEDIDNLHLIINQNRDKYYKNLENPMPIFLGESSQTNSKIVFDWENSFDLQGDKLFYNLQISSTPEFTNILYEQNNIQKTHVEINRLEKGSYYWRIITIDAKGNSQIPFDILIDENGKYFFGIKNFIIE